MIVLVNVLVLVPVAVFVHVLDTVLLLVNVLVRALVFRHRTGGRSNFRPPPSTLPRRHLRP